jgi:hypothetical protein
MRPYRDSGAERDENSVHVISCNSPVLQYRRSKSCSLHSLGRGRYTHCTYTYKYKYNKETVNSLEIRLSLRAAAYLVEKIKSCFNGDTPKGNKE